MANIEDPEETARYDPSHLDLHCLHRYLFCSIGLKMLISLHKYTWKKVEHPWILEVRCYAYQISLFGMNIYKSQEDY